MWTASQPSFAKTSGVHNSIRNVRTLIYFAHITAICLHAQMYEPWWRDRFHALLGLRLRYLILTIFLSYLAWAVTLSLLLAAVTGGQLKQCIGGATSFLDYFFFTVETMYSIGFGMPRYPACLAANWFTFFSVTTTVIFNGFTLGLIFTKFSSTTARKHSLLFSDVVCARVIPRGGGGGGRLEESAKPTAPERCPSSTAEWIRTARPELTRLREPEYDMQLQFRISSVALKPFFKAELKSFIVYRGLGGNIAVSSFEGCETDMPLEFLHIPITVTLRMSQTNPRLESFPPGGELCTMVIFVDGATSRLAQVRRSWKIDADVRWHREFTPLGKGRETSISRLSLSRPCN
eukprot:Polyplicarium_translucidae@DN2872_c0_g1_i2.p1